MEAIVAQVLLPEFVAKMIGVTFVNIVYKDSTMFLQYLTIYGLLPTCMNMCSILGGGGNKHLEVTYILCTSINESWPYLLRYIYTYIYSTTPRQKVQKLYEVILLLHKFLLQKSHYGVCKGCWCGVG